MTGPRLLAWISLSVAAMIAWIIATSDGGLVETSNTVIRWTARTSLVAKKASAGTNERARARCGRFKACLPSDEA